MSKKIIVAALSAVVAMGIAGQVVADSKTKPMKMMKGMEKCYGIAKAGKNDCGSSTQACAGQTKMDSAKNAWLAVPKGTCNKIVGGNTSEGSAA